MALDPRVRDELERRGPTNVRELLRIRTGPGDHDSVALQLAGVPDPPRSEVEDWLREAEREGETVTRDIGRRSQDEIVQDLVNLTHVEQDIREFGRALIVDADLSAFG